MRNFRNFKYIVLIIHLISVLVVAITSLSANHLIISKGFNRCEQSKNAAYLTEDSNSFSVLYKGDNKANIERIYKSNTESAHVYIEEFSIADEVYLLEREKSIYRIKKLSKDDLSVQSTSEIFVLDDIEEISDFYVNLSDNMAYITAIKNGRMGAYVYSYNLDKLISIEEELEQEAPLALSVRYRYESPDGAMSSAYYESGEIIPNSTRPIEGAIDARLYASSLKATGLQSLKLNINVFFVYLAYAIIVSIIILLVARLVDKKRRFIDLILVNEIFIIAAMCVILLFSGNIVAAILWVILVSLVNIGAILYQNRDLMILCEDMRRVSTGNMDLKEPYGTDREVRTIWRGMNEIKYLYEQYKYIQETTTAAALKFLPKGLGNIFRCASLDELKPGDSTNISGSFMIYRTQKEISNETVRLAEEYEKNTDGILLSGECSPSLLKMIFRDGETMEVREGLDFYSKAAKDNASILYFKDDFKISIVGTQTKSILNISSPQMDDMELLSKWLFRMGIKMVISQDIKDSCAISSPLRHIGFCTINGKKLNFYEVLDACSENVRTSRLEYLADFENALSLLYKKDFYLARTAFSDLLKVDSQDELSRYYLFICEEYLNNPDIDDRFCELDRRS